MLLKEAGVPVPIPSDLLIITAGVQAATGVFPLLELLLGLELAVVLGSSLQFFVVRGAGRRMVYRVLGSVGLSAGRLDALAGRLRHRGGTAIFMGLNLPGARAGMVAAAGIAGLPYAVFGPAMAAGSSVYYGWHIGLGYIAGPAALALLEGVRIPVLPVLIGLVLLGLACWLLMRRRGTATRLRAFTEAACPACLIASALQPQSRFD